MKDRKRKTKIEPVDEVIEHLESMRIETMGPMLEDGRWILLLRSVDASPGTPPASIEVHDIVGEGQYVATKDLKAAVKSAKRRQKPHGARSLHGHVRWISIEQAFDRIGREQAQGRIGAGDEAGQRNIDLARLILDEVGRSRYALLGTVPVETFPDGSQGVDAGILDKVLGSDARVDGPEDDDEE